MEKLMQHLSSLKTKLAAKAIIPKPTQNFIKSAEKAIVDNTLAVYQHDVEEAKRTFKLMNKHEGYYGKF